MYYIGVYYQLHTNSQPKLFILLVKLYTECVYYTGVYYQLHTAKQNYTFYE